MPTMLSESANGLGANSASARSVGKSSACRLERRALSCESSSVLRPALGLGSTLPTTAEPCHAGLPKAHDSKIPPEEVQKFFDGLSQKNNLCVLTGDKTAMASVEKAARQLYAAQKADGRIPKGRPQREDLEHKRQTYEQDFNATVLNLFDKVLFPIQRAGRPAQLANKALDMTRDSTKVFDGENQIEKTLTSNPLKLYLDVERDFDPVRDKAQDLLWPENQDETRWSDAADRYTEQAGMPWLPPKGLSPHSSSGSSLSKSSPQKHTKSRWRFMERRLRPSV